MGLIQTWNPLGMTLTIYDDVLQNEVGGGLLFSVVMVYSVLTLWETFQLDVRY